MTCELSRKHGQSMADWRNAIAKVEGRNAAKSKQRTHPVVVFVNGKPIYTRDNY